MFLEGADCPKENLKMLWVWDGTSAVSEKAAGKRS